MAGSSPVTRFAVESRDPEFAHGVLREAYTDFTVRPSGSADGFRFSHSGTTVPGVMIARLSYGMDVQMAVQPPQRSLIVPTRAAGPLTVESGRETVTPEIGEPILLPASRPWTVAMADVVMETVVLDWSAVRQVARSAYGPDGAQPQFSSMAPVSPSAARYWRRLVEHVRSGVLADDELMASPLVLAEATRSLATAVLTVFPNSGLPGSAPDPREEWVGPAVLRRALAYIDEHAGEDVGVDDIAVAARIGVRGLQNLFRRHRGRTPLDELRRVRMARAHADLRAADPTRGDTVAAIAARWGFANPGRFSVRYREIHGCPPSETLRH